MPSATTGIAKGEGLAFQADDMRLNDTQFPAEKHTGLIYTPPTYSDHIPVCVLLRRSLLQSSDKFSNASPVASIAERRNCQPWTKQRSLASFFGGPATKRP